MRPRGAMLAVALLTLTFHAAPMSAMAADGAAVTATNTLVGEVRLDNRNQLDDDDEYSVMINRLNVGASSDGIQVSMRIDSVTFFERPTIRYKDDVRFERLSLMIHHGALTLKAGDLYRQLGRGIVLSIRKVDELGVDLSIRGGELVWANDIHDVSLFAGVINPNNLDSVSQKHLRDPNDALAGGSYALRVIDGLELGFFGLYLQPKEPILDGRDWTTSGGLSMSMPTLGDSVAVYLEGDVQYRVLVGEAQRGWAGYGTVDTQLGDTTLFLEGLYLDDFDLRGSKNPSIGSRHTYNRPPTMQRIEEEILNNRDVLGGRFKVEHYLEGWGLLLFANALWREVEFGEPFAVRQLHGWGGIELEVESLRSTLTVSGGHRDERQQGTVVKTMTHGEVDWLQPVGGGLAFHLVSNSEYRSLANTTFLRGSSLLGVELSRWGSLTFELGYDTQDTSPGIRNIFYAGIASLEITDALRLTATGGTQRGGIKCIAGVCRDYPAFAGARLEVVGRY